MSSGAYPDLMTSSIIKRWRHRVPDVEYNLEYLLIQYDRQGLCILAQISDEDRLSIQNVRVNDFPGP